MIPETTPINPERLRQAIRRNFDLPIDHVEFLPVGMVGRHYRVETAAGERYFVTLYDDTHLAARLAAGMLDFTLPLVEGLYCSGRFEELAVPQRTVDGALSADLDGWPLLVYPYLEGRLLADEMPLSAQASAELGALVARLHAATPVAEGIPSLVREQFNFHFEAPLCQGLRDLGCVGQKDRPGRVALRDLLWPRRGTVIGLLDRLRQLAQPLRRSPPPFVICHTDLHPWNVIRTAEGRLVVVDWEGACLAPPEHDLFIFTDAGFEPFLQAYLRAGGRSELKPSTFVFYLYRRNLEDLADYIVRILYEENGAQVDLSYLDGVQDLIDSWPDLATAEQRMSAALAGALKGCWL